ncbi:MAG TPA: copper chaperone PCu(A)C [Burkholderiaceae bacterium]|nr:copper chaperone PCu(A)C [Burkholderiaceae bacterium]
MKALPLLSLVFACGLAWGQVKVEGAWVRPTVPGQQAGGGFMTLTSSGGDRLLGGSTPVAERFELHTMAMNGDVMVMRQVEGIELPAGRKVELKPGGLHVMLVGLKQPLAAGSTVPVTLRLQKAGDVKIEMQVTARAPAAGDAHKH